MHIFQKRVTTGDFISVYGTVGYLDYTVRRRIKMSEEIDGDILRKAVRITAERYPYLCVQLRLGPEGFYYDPNPSPIAVINTSDKIRLNSEETNYHVWAICYEDKNLFIDVFHGLCDGIGLSALTATLLYYYLEERYGGIKKDGIYLTDTPIEPREYEDPMDDLPSAVLPESSAASSTPVHDLINDAGMTPCETIVDDIMIRESEFLPFTSMNDSSPGTMVALLIARAIDECDPDREHEILGHYAMNARPVLKAPYGHHNCLSTINLTYTDRLKKMSFSEQCTAYRGMTFLQSDADHVRPGLETMAAMARTLAMIPEVSVQRDACHQIIQASCTAYTYVVSYTGQWKIPSMEPYIREFWTHAPGALPLIVEIKSINGILFLSIQRNFRENRYIKAFLRQLKENGISYMTLKTMPNDISEFPMPV